MAVRGRGRLLGILRMRMKRRAGDLREGGVYSKARGKMVG